VCTPRRPSRPPLTDLPQLCLLAHNPILSLVNSPERVVSVRFSSRSSYALFLPVPSLSYPPSPPYVPCGMRFAPFFIQGHCRLATSVTDCFSGQAGTALLRLPFHRLFFLKPWFNFPPEHYVVVSFGLVETVTPLVLGWSGGATFRLTLFLPGFFFSLKSPT